MILWIALLSFTYHNIEANILGLFGYFIAYVLFWLFGIAIFPLLTLISGFAVLKAYNPVAVETGGADFNTLSSKMRKGMLVLFAVSLSMLMTAGTKPFPWVAQPFYWFIGTQAIPLGGVPSAFLFYSLPWYPLAKLFNTGGTALISLTGIVLSLYVIFEPLLKVPFFMWQAPKISREPNAPQTKSEDSKLKIPSSDTKFLANTPLEPTFSKLEFETKLAEKKSKQIVASRPKLETVAPAINLGPTTLLKKDPLPHQPIEGLKLQLPSIDLLNDPKKCDISQLKSELKDKAALLEATLLNFGIEAKVGQIHCGPTITSFEVHPAVGVKVGKIKTLEHDLALNMEAKAIRIIAPIPGKAAVGIEVPNSKPQEVSFKEVLTAYIESGNSCKIPMILGKAVSGELVVCDLAKLPHCIIAGATGSGKSVCINSIVISIIMLMKPDEIRLLMIDPKKVELTPYAKLPHMLAPVITEPEAAANALNWLVKEMEKRYEILKITGHRNIDSFNKRTIKEDEKHALIEIPASLPYIVALIDELADLMMISTQDIETPIARLAQMARAVGIHVILATQRPSREVITGLIKANFPARIAFKVASRVNSQIILDDVGAETLLGNGDMLLLMPGSSQLIRAQGVFVRDDEIHRVREHLELQGNPKYVIQSFDKYSTSGTDPFEDDEPTDSLFEEAKQIVFSTGNASTTFLQRKLKIGYARAASIMDQLELKGVVGPQEGSKPRTIYFAKPASQREEEETDHEFEEVDE